MAAPGAVAADVAATYFFMFSKNICRVSVCTWRKKKHTANFFLLAALGALPCAGGTDKYVDSRSGWFSCGTIEDNGIIYR